MDHAIDVACVFRFCAKACILSLLIQLGVERSDHSHHNGQGRSNYQVGDIMPKIDTEEVQALKLKVARYEEREEQALEDQLKGYGDDIGTLKERVAALEGLDVAAKRPIKERIESASIFAGGGSLTIIIAKVIEHFSK